MKNIFKNLSDTNKLKKFFDDKEKVTTQFKALHGYGGSVSQQERKQFHQKNYRRAFSVCRNALDEYAKRGATATRKKDGEDIKRPCEIMESLSRLCQDIPHLVKQNWNHNALSELFIKFLNFNTNEEIRLKCITFIFVVINAAKDSSHKKYIECLKYSPDFTPFCIEAPFENYYNNFKKNLIVAQDALPWTRTGPTNKKHCLSILSQLLSLIKDVNDFKFWYLYIIKHIYPQLYYKCTCDNSKLVNELFINQEEIKFDNIESEGFGSIGPPSQIQSLFTQWFCSLLTNQSKNEIILSKKIYILYAMEIIKYTMKLPIGFDNNTIIIYNILKQIEKWLLGINLTNKFIKEIQNYYQMIIIHLFNLFEINISDLSINKLNKKLNLICYGIYLLRLISGEPYIKLSPKTWKCLINGIIKKIKYYKNNKLKYKQQQQEIEEKVVHPLIHCLFKSFILMSISDTKTANILLTQFKFEINILIEYQPFVIQWREIIRNITIELLGIISPKQEEKEKNYIFHSSNNTLLNKKIKSIPNQSLEINLNSYNFSIESRLKQLNIDIFEFRGLDEAFMIYDRLLHLLGSPLLNNKNNIIIRQIHLEGFCDSLKIFISSLNIKERTAARIKKEQAFELMRRKQQEQEEKEKKQKKEVLTTYNNYGFPHSLISVPIDISQVILNGNLSESIRKNLPLPPREQLPQGDTLIQIFGPWLFDICLDILLNSSLTEQVNRLIEFKMSFECLSYIFLTNCEITFNNLYLSTYYKIIKLSFGQKVSQKIRSIVIHECCKGCIFGKNLNGVNCLISDFLQCMQSIVGYDGNNKLSQKYIPKKANSIFQKQEANDSLTIAMSLICFAAHFDNLRINTFPIDNDDKKNNNNSLLTFSQIKTTINNIFSYIAHFDNLPINIINTVIWGSVLIIYDEVSSTKDIKIISTAIRSIVNGTNINKLRMAKIATRAIESLSPICDQICEINSNLISKNLFKPFLENIQEFVKNAGNKDLQKRKEICKICTDQIYCCLEWMFRFPPNVLTNDELMISYFKMLHCSLCLQAKLPIKRSLHQNVTDKHPLADLVLAAVTSKMMLFHYLGNFPLLHDSGAISSNASDDYKGSQEGNVFLSYDNNTLITANDRILSHQAGPEPGVRFLLRDESGKFAWNFTPCSIQSKPSSSSSSSTTTIKPSNTNQKYKPKYKNIQPPPPPSLDNINKKQQLPPPPIINTMTENKQNNDDDISFNNNLSKINEKKAKVFEKRNFNLRTDINNKDDGLKQVLNYVSRELTPPAGKINKQSTYKKKQIITTPKDKNESSPSSSSRQKRTNSGSFPSGHLSDKSRAKLAKYMDEQKKEEMDLYKQYEKLRQHQMKKLKKLQTELAKEEETKEDGGIKHALNDMKIREAVTGFDCSRFLLSHFGILTPGHVLGVKDSLFSDVTSDDLSDSNNNSNGRRQRPLSPPTHINYNNNNKYQSLKTPITSSSNQSRHKSFSGHQKNTQYRLDPYLYSLDQNLLAMFGNKDNAFHRRLRLLDQSSFEREKHKIGVVYVGPDQDEQKLILANENGSLSYRRFINKLGWKVDLLQHQGFNGAMNASTTGRYCKYYCTAIYEMAFHIATTMPTNYNDQQQTEKKKHIGNDQVNIIWTDNGREYIIDTIYSHFNQVQIIIYPLNNGLYRIKIHKKSDVGNFGPLLNNMIIRESLLTILVRITSLYANRTVRYAQSVYTRAFVERKKYLDEAIDKNSHKSHESILGAFFPYMAAAKH